MGAGSGDSCALDEPCVTRLSSEAEFRAQLVPSGAAATTLHADETGRLRSSRRLVVLAVTADRSLASGLIRGAARRTCAQHQHESTFLELPVDGFPGAAELARGLGVSRLPTVISFRDGERLDHICGREARREEDFSDFIQRNL